MARPGLSPLARGNRLAHGVGELELGPIPARAGQPPPRAASIASRRAYPRSRGATTRGCPGGWPQEGLSPLARGNLGARADVEVCLGPIPARAGQPDPGAVFFAQAGAYPRSRGATWQSFANRPFSMGLSPLARGNRDLVCKLAGDGGPIPARAGQPPRSSSRRPLKTAYPRSRGATMSGSVEVDAVMGLSPLARGNLKLGQ